MLLSLIQRCFCCSVVVDISGCYSPLLAIIENQVELNLCHEGHSSKVELNLCHEGHSSKVELNLCHEGHSSKVELNPCHEGHSCQMQWNACNSVWCYNFDKCAIDNVRKNCSIDLVFGRWMHYQFTNLILINYLMNNLVIYIRCHIEKKIMSLTTQWITISIAIAIEKETMSLTTQRYRERDNVTNNTVNYHKHCHHYWERDNVTNNTVNYHKHCHHYWESCRYHNPPRRWILHYSAYQCH